jgi:N-acyl-L-homoserine lactone synthetase
MEDDKLFGTSNNNDSSVKEELSELTDLRKPIFKDEMTDLSLGSDKDK